MLIEKNDKMFKSLHTINLNEKGSSAYKADYILYLYCY